ncbi:MAG TPA: TIGR02300 family protein [Geminicoccaceae bacterium]|nr:TIGR02300 family protein [Geminicoccaceae bacterium]
MAKPEWGTKRACLSCGARFYDFHRSPITCPSCGATFDAETVSRARRARPAPRVALVPDEVVPDVVAADDDVVVGVPGLEPDAEGDDEAEVIEPVEEEEDEALIEDASELGEDDEDMSEVIETGLDEDEDHR